MSRIPDWGFPFSTSFEPLKPPPRMSLREYLSYLDPVEPPPSSSPKVLLLSWQDDSPDIISSQVSGLSKIFKETFGYNGINQIRHFEIPSTDPYAALSQVIQEFKKDQGPDELLIVYYIGGGTVLGSDQFWNPRSWRSIPTIPFPPLPWSILQSYLLWDAKVLLLLDCFSTSDSVRLSMPTPSTITEVITAGGAESFSRVLREVLTAFGTEHTSFTAAELYAKIDERYVGASQHPFRICRCWAGTAEEPSISIVKQGTKNDGEPEGCATADEAIRELQ